MSGSNIINQGFVVEAVNVDKPNERAYCYLESLEGMRGAVLEEYIDEYLKISGPKVKKSKKKDDNDQVGKEEKIDKISFSEDIPTFLKEYEEEKNKERLETGYEEEEVPNVLEDLYKVDFTDIIKVPKKLRWNLKQKVKLDDKWIPEGLIVYI